MIDLLFKYGFNPQYASKALSKAVENNQPQALQALIGHKVDVNSDQGAALIQAVLNNYDDIIAILLQNSANVDLIPPLYQESGSCLIQAIETKNTKIAQMILEKNPDIHKKNSHNRTALDLAVENLDVQIVQALIEKGANVNRIYDRNYDIWAEGHRSKEFTTPLIELSLFEYDNPESRDKAAQIIKAL